MKKTITAIIAMVGILSSSVVPTLANDEASVSSHVSTIKMTQNNVGSKQHKGLFYNPLAPKTIDVKNLSNNANMWRTDTSSVTSGVILPATTFTGDWGTSTLYAQDGNQEFYWKVSPYDLESYEYTMTIDLYTNAIDPTYLGSVGLGTAGIGSKSGYVSYDMTDLPPGQYYAKLTGFFSGSEGTEGTVGGVSGAAGTVFNIAI